MREQKRIRRIIKLIEKLWNKYPDQRFGQLLINNNIVPDNLAVWNNEDGGFEEYLKAIIKEEEKRR